MARFLAGAARKPAQRTGRVVIKLPIALARKPELGPVGEQRAGLMALEVTKIFGPPNKFAREKGCMITCRGG